MRATSPPGTTVGMRNRTTLLTATAVALLATGSAGAATASARSFDLTTAKGANGGQAHGYGSVAFVAPRKVAIRGRINDMCPKDGYGAYIEFKVNFRGGGYATVVRKDTTTCKTAHGVGYSLTQAFPKRVASVGVTVIELDQKSGGVVPGDAARVLLKR